MADDLIAPAKRRRPRRLATTLAAAAALTTGLIAASVNPAEARPPRCVTTRLNDAGFTDHLRVTNGCSRAVRVKVVLAHKSDFACYTIRAHRSRNYSWSWPGRFDGLQDC